MAHKSYAKIILLAMIFTFLSPSCDAVLTNHHTTTPAGNHHIRAGTVDTFDTDMTQHDTQEFADDSSIPALSVLQRAKQFVISPFVLGTSVIMAALGGGTYLVRNSLDYNEVARSTHQTQQFSAEFVARARGEWKVANGDHLDTRRLQPADRIYGMYSNFGYKSRTGLGTGVFGDVYKARSNSKGVYDTAIKVFREKPKGETEDSAEDFFERAVTTDLTIPKHRNLLHLKEFHFTSKPYWISYPYCEYREFAEYLLTQKQYSTERFITHLISAVKGLMHLHQHGVSHGDLKLENILICKISPGAEDESTEDVELKLADFGVLPKCAKYIRSVSGTGGTFSIELALSEYDLIEEMDWFLEDIFVMGMMMGILAAEHESHHVGSDKRIIHLVIDLCARMRKQEPKARPSLSSVLEELQKYKSMTAGL